MTDSCGPSVTVRASVAPLAVIASPLSLGWSVVSAYRAGNVPVSSAPSADGVVATGELTVSVRVVGSAPVLVIVRMVIATFSWVMNLR